MKKFPLLAAACAIALAVLIVVHQLGSPAVQQHSFTRLLTTTPSAGNGETGRFQATTPSDASHPSDIHGSLFQDYSASTNLRAFVDSLSSRVALHDPDAEYWSAMSMEECVLYSRDPNAYLMNARSNESRDRNVNASQESALASRVQRCSGFAPHQLSMTDVQRLYDAAARHGSVEARVRSILTLRTPLSDELAARTLSDVKASRDPSAIFALADIMGVRETGSSAGLGPYSGKNTDYYAWKLAACDMGYPCSADSPVLIGLCINTGVCGYPNLESAFRAAFLSPDDYDRVVATKNRIIAYIDTQP